MGFLKDIEDMPNQYEYSLKFFDRYYRPEYTTIVVAGDVQHKQVRQLVEKYWGNWKRGSYKAEDPRGAAAGSAAHRPPRLAHADPAVGRRGVQGVPPTSMTPPIPPPSTRWPSWLSRKIPSFTRSWSSRSRRWTPSPATRPTAWTPGLFTILARVKNPGDMDYVRDQVLETVAAFRDKPVSKERLETVKKHLRYSFSLRMDNSEAIAGTVARFVALRRTPETINRLYEMYARLTPEDVQRRGREIPCGEQPDHCDACRPGRGRRQVKSLLAMFLLASAAFAQMRVVDMPGKSPLVTFRIVFTTGAAADPADKPGLA